MTFNELKQTSVTELPALLNEQRGVLRDLEFQAHEGQLKQVHKIGATKKLIARILTLLNTTTVTKS